MGHTTSSEGSTGALGAGELRHPAPGSQRHGEAENISVSSQALGEAVFLFLLQGRKPRRRTAGQLALSLLTH